MAGVPLFGPFMIIGIGIDIVRAERIQKAVEKWGRRFLDRIFTPGEQAYCLQRNPSSLFLGGRFAVKEALLKAAGTGWSGGVRWRDIETGNLPGGKPFVQVSGRVSELLADKKVTLIHVSISHDTDYSVGQVILESR